ncbi:MULTISPECIES: hemerythrin domain-containing protein [unclassified Methylophaga]|jgi:iron-sulfur cluster repair protein YtfE (RIC family)|uniref:Hemerythrin n=1 Tax=Pseudidiomarina aestuarii TaxID=624146 RepID=A0A2T4CX98_9GAMM|nr:MULTISPECIES: hemerythrin domain-containing protein [unclassified Methylophaga]MAL50798.1 hemerythrin [Methylophaga sp.]MBP26119.1 hemerythrin [Methylophaga sp.]PTB86142.1 hemerythrin [Pseudidiomarina aestuarii]HCC79766.1 hemerythrin [Methylophaga sp.]|tara:strand:- start:904 stop:1365 length:462 start_codon:yes stop_codon:yes gene_type:complete
MTDTKKTQHNAITLLKKDHQKVKQAFAQYEELGPYAFVHKKKLADQICAELTLHTQLEEEIIYPAFREKLSDEKDLLNEAKVEHDSAKVLIKEIQQMQADEELFDAKVKVLSEYIEHHVKEEEDEMFPLLQKSDVDLALLGEKLFQRKQQLNK